jgi:hypothetical protein
MDPLPVVLEVLRGVLSEQVDVRTRSADEVTDIMGSLGEWDVDLVARTLASAWLVEDADEAREAQLHALSELSVAHGLPDAVRRRVLAVPIDRLPEPHREYLLGMREDDAGSR